ncbi:MAG: lysophospholipid acyltransferase family protein [Parvularculaceae bacterium]|nr:lysophospholipid acyltransferase family protein [Parvularculaceae bacterium]
MAKSQFIKKLIQSDFAGGVASFFIGSYIRLVRATSRFTFVDRRYAQTLLAGDQGFILAFWHSRLLMAATVRDETDKPVFMLISTHRDGEIIANAVKGFGVDFIRGSAANPKKKEKDKSGASAIAQMIARLNEGAIVGVTPDGPRGPRQNAKIGVIKLAAYSGAPILPAAYATSRGWTLGTWDRFFLAAPFSRGAFAAGPPIHVPRNATAQELESARAHLENTLNQTLANANAAIHNKS